MSDRIAVMNRGRFEQLGDPEALYERPSTRFVAGFLGVSNLLAGTVETRAADYAVVRLPGDARVRVPGGLVNGASSIAVGVRPEKIRLHDAGATPPSNTNTLPGRVVDASYLGVSTQYIVTSATGEQITVYEQNVERTSHGSLYRPGQQVNLSWSPDHTFVIPEEAAPLPTA
jgi:spermidine/putrescine transport system ATP-binding protein